MVISLQKCEFEKNISDIKKDYENIINKNELKYSNKQKE
jgi:hypothetical protein